MMKVEVLIPFLDKVTGESRDKDDIFEVSEERLAEIRKVNVNMVRVLEEVIEEPKPKAKKQKAKATK